MARVCYSACKCENNFGDLLAKFNQAARSSPPAPSGLKVPEASKVKANEPQAPSKAKTATEPNARVYACTIYCDSASGPTIRRETQASSRMDAARILGDQAEQLCRSSGHTRASSLTLPERQCYER
jgi:hypothetical protein